MSRKTIYKKVKHTLGSYSDYDEDYDVYRGYSLRDKIETIIDNTKDKYKDYKLVKLISVISPGKIVEDRMDYNYPFRGFQESSFYNDFESNIWSRSEFVAKVGFVFEK